MKRHHGRSNRNHRLRRFFQWPCLYDAMDSKTWDGTAVEFGPGFLMLYALSYPCSCLLGLVLIIAQLVYLPWFIWLVEHCCPELSTPCSLCIETSVTPLGPLYNNACPTYIKSLWFASDLNAIVLIAYTVVNRELPELKVYKAEVCFFQIKINLRNLARNEKINLCDVNLR